MHGFRSKEVRECHATSAARSLQKKCGIKNRYILWLHTPFKAGAQLILDAAQLHSSHVTSIWAFNNMLSLLEDTPLAHSLPTTIVWFLYTSDMNSIFLIRANGNDGNSNKNKHCIQYLNTEFSGQLVQLLGIIHPLSKQTWCYPTQPHNFPLPTVKLKPMWAQQ